jgi:hypothetical protein
MSSDFRPEPQDGFSSYDRDLHEYQEGTVGSFEEQFDDDYYGDDDCAGYDAYLDGVDEDEYEYEDDGQPSEYDEWMDFDPDC